MKYKPLVFVIIIIMLLSGCSQPYNGPYPNTKLLTKEDVKKQIATDTALIKNTNAPLIKQVQAKQDIKFYKMILAAYEFYEAQIKNVDGKQYTITADSIYNFIKNQNFSKDLKQIESDQNKWPGIFLGNLARYFNSIGFGVYQDTRMNQENIIINW